MDQNKTSQQIKNAGTYIVTGWMLSTILVHFWPSLKDIQTEIAGVLNLVLYVLNLVVKKVWDINIGG